MAFEFFGGPTELIVPENIHDLLDHALIPATELNRHHRETEKFFVDGYPDLFVRFNEEGSVNDITTAITAANGLRRYGLSILPSQIIEHDEQVFVITNRVSGKNLEDVLSDHPSQDFLQHVDRIWEGFGLHLLDHRSPDTMVASDIYSVTQHMLGNIVDDTASRVWLVDLPTTAFEIGKDLTYADITLDLTNSIVEVESLTGSRLLLARVALRQALNAVTKLDPWNGLVVNAAHYALNHGVQVSVGEDGVIKELPIVRDS